MPFDFYTPLHPITLYYHLPTGVETAGDAVWCYCGVGEPDKWLKEGYAPLATLPPGSLLEVLEVDGDARYGESERAVLQVEQKGVTYQCRLLLEEFEGHLFPVDSELETAIQTLAAMYHEVLLKVKLGS